MPAVSRLYDEGTRRGQKWLRELGEEFRHARLRLGLTQLEVANAVRIDRADYSRIEAGKLVRMSMLVACRIGAVLGLDVTARAFPGGPSIRDKGQTPRLAKLTACIGAPLRYRAEVPLPRMDGHREQRAWDLMLIGHGERTGVDFEARLYDFQAQLRKIHLKERDDPVDHVLLVVADTVGNRRALAEFDDLLVDFPRNRVRRGIAPHLAETGGLTGSMPRAAGRATLSLVSMDHIKWPANGQRCSLVSPRHTEPCWARRA